MTPVYVTLGTCLVGLIVSLCLQVWIQPKWFREDGRAQAKQIIDGFTAQIGSLTGKFDAQLALLKLDHERAQATLDGASKFFSAADVRFAEIENRLHNLEQQAHVTHRLVESLNRLDRRVACVEAVCHTRHGDSLRVELERREDADE